MTFCPSCGSTQTERNGYCATCNHAARKAEREAGKVKVVKPIRKVSTKRASQNKEYLKLEKEYLQLYPVCEVVECHNKSNQVHHMAGRSNEMLLRTDYFLAVCPDCHQWITEDSAKAIELGYSVLRSTTQL